METKRVLLIGGLGFIGSHLSRAFLDTGAQVTVVEKSLGPVKERRCQDILGRVKLIRCDALDVERYADELAKADIVANLVWRRTVALEEIENDWKTNCLLPARLLDAAQNAARKPLFLHFGTRHQYGEQDSLPVKETAPCRPAELYGIHRLASENYHLLYHERHGIPVICYRLSNVYGPHAEKDDMQQESLLLRIIATLKKDGTFVVAGGEQLKDFIYVGDLVDAVMATLKGDCIGETFNLGSGERLTLAQAIEIVREVVGKGDISRQPKGTGDPAYLADVGKIHERTGWQPKVTFKDGIGRMIGGAQ